MMLAESGYVDANPVNAGIVDWPDGYEWCSYAAACRSDETARSGYDFVYGGKGRPWLEGACERRGIYVYDRGGDGNWLFDFFIKGGWTSSSGSWATAISCTGTAGGSPQTSPRRA